MFPGWASSAIWYSVYPLGACGAPIWQEAEPGVQHRLGRLEGWLDNVVSLGANGLALGPIWRSSTHGYDIVNHDEIDPRLGDDADFDKLVQACHQRGLRVLLDGVFNHVSTAHPDVEAARRDGIDSPAGRLFRHDSGQADGLARFEGHDGLVEYDHSNPAVADRVVGTMTRWLRRGADGWRLDAAYRVPRAFWADVIARVDGEFPQALTVAEVLHGDYARFAADTGIDSVTQYELWKALWSALKDNNPHELSWTLQRLAAGLAENADFLPWTFVGNHDVTRIATQVGPRKAVAATALLATLPGMPAVYYGDEYGLTGLKEERAGGDDAIRPELPARLDGWLDGSVGSGVGSGAGRRDGAGPADVGGLADDTSRTGSTGIGAAGIDTTGIDATVSPDGTVSSAEILRQHQLLFGLRRRHAWLQWADLAIVEQKHQHLAYRLAARRAAGSAEEIASQYLDVSLDTSDGQSSVAISDSAGVLYRW